MNNAQKHVLTVYTKKVVLFVHILTEVSDGTSNGHTTTGFA